MNFAVIFSGQGLQSVQHLHEIQDQASQYGLTTQLKSLTNQLESTQLEQTKTEQEAIFENTIAQPLIFALQYLRWQQIREYLPQPEFLAGYSLGEASAFCCSSSLPFAQAFELISIRAKLMSQQMNTRCGMAAIQGLNRNQLLPLLERTKTEISIRLNETHYIVAGPVQRIDQLIQAANEQGAQQVNRLKVSVPSHTSFLKNAAEQFSNYCHQLPIGRMELPVISASEGQKYFSYTQALPILSQQIDHPLDWYRCLETLKEYQPDIVLEIGPGNTLSKMIGTVMPEVQVRSIDDFSSFDGVRQWISRFI